MTNESEAAATEINKATLQAQKANEEEIKVQAGISRQHLRVLRIVFTILFLISLVWLGVMTKIMFFPSPAATVFRAEINTPVVMPTGRGIASGEGVVRMTTYVSSPLDPTCLANTEYFIMVADGSVIVGPGLRRTSPGDVKRAVYEVTVPMGTVPGRARFWVRDIYNCGVQIQMVETPHLPFLIRPSIGLDVARPVAPSPPPGYAPLPAFPATPPPTH